MSIFFRNKFINKCSKTTAPITDLTNGHFTSKKRKIGIKNKYNAFELLKENLTHRSILKHFNPELEIII